MRIAHVIPGRFHGFDLARALIGRGHDVTVFTNYPSWAADRFGLPTDSVRSFVAHGVLARMVDRVAPIAGKTSAEPWLHRMFGRWAARELRGESWDVIHCWTGVSEELLRDRAVRSRLTLLMRGSSHIVEQGRLLRDEEDRAGVAIDRPTEWMTARELREYGLADRILVLSTFARETFIRHGVPAERLRTVVPGVRVDAFRPPAEHLEGRCRRVLAGEPLRVLYVGALSFRKGFLDLAAVIDRLHDGPFRFTLIGPALPEVRAMVHRLGAKVEVPGKLPQEGLPSRYWDADLFVFPTIEDGFGVVLAQARAAALPVITTPNCAGIDLVADGRDGWLVPIRDPEAIVARLRACHADREGTAARIRQIYDTYQARDWSRMARDFEAVCEPLLRDGGSRFDG